MELIEKLEYHINRLWEGKARYDYVRSGYKGSTQVEICINPNSNEFKDFLSSQKGLYNGVRGLLYRGEWYFWNQILLLHEDVRDGYEFNYRSFPEFVGNSVEITHHNTIHQDHWDKIRDLATEMSKQEYFKVLAIHLKALKDLKSKYNTNIGDVKQIFTGLINLVNGPEEDPMRGMTKQQRHDYRKKEYDARSREVEDIFKGF